MSKYLVETFYTCTFKVKHFLDKIDQKELNNIIDGVNTKAKITRGIQNETK